MKTEAVVADKMEQIAKSHIDQTRREIALLRSQFALGGKTYSTKGFVRVTEIVENAIGRAQREMIADCVRIIGSRFEPAEVANLIIAGLKKINSCFKDKGLDAYVRNVGQSNEVLARLDNRVAEMKRNTEEALRVAAFEAQMQGEKTHPSSFWKRNRDTIILRGIIAALSSLAALASKFSDGQR